MPTMQSCVALLAVALQLSAPALAQDQNVQFNQVVNLNGDVSLHHVQHEFILTRQTDATKQTHLPRWIKNRNVLTRTKTNSRQPEPSTTSSKPCNRVNRSAFRADDLYIYADCHKQRIGSRWSTIDHVNSSSDVASDERGSK